MKKKFNFVHWTMVNYRISDRYPHVYFRNPRDQPDA